jgi:Flp pilus assembly protein TadD
VGLLTAHGGGYYSIHPALPWFFKRLFDDYYGGSEDRTARAYVEVLAFVALHYVRRYRGGQREVINSLAAQEANLLHARDVARSRAWWRLVLSTMDGLGDLYDQAGRPAEWRRLVQEIVPDFVDPATDGPLPGREEAWGLLTDYRVRLAREGRQWKEAERLQRILAEWSRKHASQALAIPPERGLDDAQRAAILALAVSIEQLGHIQRVVGQAACVESFRESYELDLRADAQAAAGVVAYNLGIAYQTVPGIRDLEEAQRWYQLSLELSSEGDRLARAKSLTQLGSLAYERSRDARKAGRPAEEVAQQLGRALEFCGQALELLPDNSIKDLAVTHGQLGAIYVEAGDLDLALAHLLKSIACFESVGDIHGAAQIRENVAIALTLRGRFADAREYALAALRNYQTYGEGAKDDVLKTLELIALIDKA